MKRQGLPLQKFGTNARLETTMKVSEAMISDVRIANPNDTLQQAAQIMAEIDAGILPVGENDRLVGMVTDRDITIRAVGTGLGPDVTVRHIMTEDVKYCYDDQDIEEVVEKMGDIQVRRLPVLNRDKRLVGILSLGDIAKTEEGIGAAEALTKITQPGGQHTTEGGRYAPPKPTDRGKTPSGTIAR
jgi:CBS domain-containing protein